jgi:hypothetical protein
LHSALTQRSYPALLHSALTQRSYPALLHSALTQRSYTARLPGEDNRGKRSTTRVPAHG